jgi:hypothetical protein
MLELIVIAPASLFIAYRTFVIVVAVWMSRPNCRVDIERFERVISAVAKQSRTRPTRRRGRD